MLDSFLHGFRWFDVATIFLLLFCHTFSGTFHRLLHILITLVDNLLYPRLRLEHLQRFLLVTIEEHKQVAGEFEALFVSVAVFSAGQLVAIASVNDRLNIIALPLKSLPPLGEVGGGFSLPPLGEVGGGFKFMMYRLRLFLTIHGGVLSVKIFVIVVE